MRVAGRLSSVSEVPWKALMPIEVRATGKMRMVSRVQPRKAPGPITSSAVGRTMEVIDSQSEKAKSPMVVRPDGRLTSERALSPWKV